MASGIKARFISFRAELIISLIMSCSCSDYQPIKERNYDDFRLSNEVTQPSENKTSRLVALPHSNNVKCHSGVETQGTVRVGLRQRAGLFKDQE